MAVALDTRRAVWPQGAVARHNRPIVRQTSKRGRTAHISFVQMKCGPPIAKKGGSYRMPPRRPSRAQSVATGHELADEFQRKPLPAQPAHFRQCVWQKSHEAQPQLGRKLNRPECKASRYSRITANSRRKCCSPRAG